jgi:hypothetical protein
MSDYLGMLAARYLNQAGSIRPEPVSMYQPPSAEWQLAVDSSPGDEVPFDEPGLPISPARRIAIDDGEGRPQFPSPTGGRPGGGALADAEPSPAQASPREPDVVAQPTGADDVGLPPASGRGALPGPGAWPSPPQGSSRDRDVVAQASQAETVSVTETVSVRLAAAPPPPLPVRPVFPSPIGEASSIPSPSGGVSSVPFPAGGGQGGGEREVETSTPQPPEAVRSLVVERSAGPEQPVHPSPGPRVEREAPARGPSPTLAENHEHSQLPQPSIVFSETAQAGSEPPVAALAPARMTPGIAHATIEPLPQRVAPSLALSHTRAPSLPSRRGGGESVTAGSREIKPDPQPIVEISIDEISIRAAPPPPAPATPRRERLVHPPMSLEDYLRRRSAGVSR